MTCPSGPALDDEAEQFAAFPASSSSWAAGEALAAGSQITIKSLKTGKFCQVVPSGGRQQVGSSAIGTFQSISRNRGGSPSR
jgi:hypothetical protein